jgi:hypothetical protein
MFLKRCTTLRRPLAHAAVKPPSASRAVPVTNDALSDSSHTTASAISSGTLALRRGRPTGGCGPRDVLGDPQTLTPPGADATDVERQDEPTQEIAAVIGDDVEKQPYLVGPEAMTGELAFDFR